MSPLKDFQDRVKTAGLGGQEVIYLDRGEAFRFDVKDRQEKSKYFDESSVL
jgi:hypothetical protein